MQKIGKGKLNTPLDLQKRSHRISAACLCLTCVLIAVLLASVLCPSRKERAYPFEYSVASYNPYEQQLDAFLKGQLHIDFEPSDELLELENPYDYYERYRSGAEYLWDRALYDGKYYSYFGIAPILTVYLPYYLVRGALPADDFVSTVFTVMTALFFSLSVIKLCSMSKIKRIPILTVWACAIGGLFATQCFLIMRGEARFYYIAVSAAMAFLSAFTWLFLSGLSIKESKMSRRIFLALAGVAYGLCFLSRVNTALMGAFLVLPMLWFFIVKDGQSKKTRSVKDIIFDLAVLGAPVVVAVAGQMILNYLRFDSFFEFGTTYQLTVSDISKNKLRLTDLPYAFYHYFLHPLGFAEGFSAELFYQRFEDYGHFVYVDTGMGLLSIPFFWLLFVSIFTLAEKKQSLARRITLASLLVGGLAVAWMNFCLGGVIFRYTCDITLVMALAAIASVVFAHDSFDPKGKGIKVLNVAVGAVVAVSVFVCLTLCFSHNVNLSEYSIRAYQWIGNILR